jgi:hypothetical protein
MAGDFFFDLRTFPHAATFNPALTLRAGNDLLRERRFLKSGRMAPIFGQPHRPVGGIPQTIAFWTVGSRGSPRNIRGRWRGSINQRSSLTILLTGSLPISKWQSRPPIPRRVRNSTAIRFGPLRKNLEIS